MKHGKRYREAVEKIEPGRAYPHREGIELMLAVKYAGFSETAEVAINLGVDPRHADQNVRGAVVLPHGTGQDVRVIVFAKGDKEREAREAGADEVGAEDLAKRIQEGWLDFDRVIATPDMMSVVGRLGRVLGPRGLMPNPKVGTVTFEVAQAIGEQKAGKIEFRVDKNGIVHAPFGKDRFGVEKLSENLLAVMDAVLKVRPQTAKGTYVKKVAISMTMGPGISLDPSGLQSALN
ncbi:MAG: 50S ribosomal protein L1 [Planctomycetota bacterium]